MREKEREGEREGGREGGRVSKMQELPNQTKNHKLLLIHFKIPDF